jgi:hypothetical protein
VFQEVGRAPVGEPALEPSLDRPQQATAVVDYSFGVVERQRPHPQARHRVRRLEQRHLLGEPHLIAADGDGDHRDARAARHLEG